jgi:hypothetical protein
VSDFRWKLATRIGDSRWGSTECQGFIGECTVCTVRYERQACTMTASDDPMQPLRVGKRWAVLKPELKFAMVDKRSLNTLVSCKSDDACRT